MDVKLDDDIRANRARFQTETRQSLSPWSWVLIIAVGVYLGNMATWASQKSVDYLLLRMALIELNKLAAEQNERIQKTLTEQSRVNATSVQNRQIENERRRAGLRQATETCDFWRQVYRQQASSQNKIYRDQACALVNQFR